MRSMTGYGAAEGPVGKGKLFIEVKSVNHRFCDINPKIPAKMGVLEPLIRKHVERRFTRGKIDIFIKEKKPLFGGVKLSVDIELARQYQRHYAKLARALQLPKDADFMRYVGLERFMILEEKEGSYEKMWRQVETLLKRATDHVMMMQRREGANLLKEQRRQVGVLMKLVKRMQRETTRVMGQHERRMRKRLGSANGVAGAEQRLQMEVSFLGGRQDIAEELTRLASHIDQYGTVLKAKNEPVGRKLDFLLQEMNREINTIGSKAADVVISRLVVESKAMLERLREQVQNVE